MLRTREIVNLIYTLLLIVMIMSPSEANMQDTRSTSYFVKLLGTREGWPDNMTEDENRIIGEHFVYLQELTLKGKVLMAGPVFGQFGMIVLRVTDQAEAREIMEAEPSVVQGVHTYEMHEMVTSLISHNLYSERYPLVQSERELTKEAVVGCLPAVAWQKWTTNEGAQTFFSPNTKIELIVGGPYEIYFDTSAPPDSQGSEDCKVLSYLPERMLTFEWNAPPKFGLLRNIKTRVVLTFEPVGNDSTKIVLHHLGWGTGSEWEAIYDYFDSAWGYVMGNFSKVIEEGE